MKRLSAIGFGWAILAAGGVHAVSQESLKAFVPVEWRGWTIEEDRIFDAETIFAYIDGAGEVYRSYNMKSLFARRLKSPGRPALIVDLFDMGTADDAFGVFTHNPNGDDAGTGQGSAYQGGLLSFWKDRFYVSVYAEDETPETREAVLTLGREIDKAIPRTGDKPALLGLLPPEGLDSRTVRFFHNYSVLNYHYFVADGNILLLDQTTSAVLASYGDGSRLLVVRYPDATKAAAARSSFGDAFLAEGGDRGVAVTAAGKWTAARLEGKTLIIVFQAPSRDSAEGLARKTGGGIR
jgi:hypothetical protein